MVERNLAADAPNLVGRAAAVATAIVGAALFALNIALINRALYDFGIWAVPPLGAFVGLMLFGLIWGGRPFVHKFMTESE